MSHDEQARLINSRLPSAERLGRAIWLVTSDELLPLIISEATAKGTLGLLPMPAPAAPEVPT